jgi:hypothetical protein
MSVLERLFGFWLPPFTTPFIMSPIFCALTLIGAMAMAAIMINLFMVFYFL